jgi:hypothetical protein
MAGNFDDDKEGKPLRDLTSDSGLGNLPPLSDFDSQAGAAFDSDGLPPLGNFGSGGGAARGITPSEDDLSAISDLDVETPGVGADLYSSGGGVNSPSSPTPSTGFQDLAADSDFSPETPEIGPGPDSNLDTPMFDSAFGGGSQFDRNMRASLDTPAPTQAMETPMFGASSAPRAAGGGGFGDDGFDLGGPMGGGFGGFDAGGAVGGGFNMGGGGGGIDFDAGTPAPDFSPDTRAPMTGNDGKKGKGGGGQSTGTLIGVGVAALVVGIVASSLFLSPYIPEMINPTLAAKNAAEADAASSKQQIATANQRAAKAEQLAAELQAKEAANPGGGNVTEQLSKAQEDLNRIAAELETKTADLQAIERDVLAKNEEFLQAQQMYEDLKNETSITQARQKGLIAEIERLTTYTGELEEANKRRIDTRDSLAHAVDRLIIQIQEGMPLTPEKYSHQIRVASAQALRDQIEGSNWVSPEIQEAYNKLYLQELEIAQSNEYFFAKLRVTDEFGNKANKWAECLMQGNWSVAYRTLDGKNIGEYANLAAPGEPVRWGFREDLPQDVKVNLEQKVFSSRVEGFEEKIAVIATKQLAAEEGTAFQAAFSSL